MLFGDYLHAGRSGREDNLRVGNDIAFLIRRFPGNRFEIDAEALLRNCRTLDDAIDAAMGDEPHIRALEGRNN